LLNKALERVKPRLCVFGHIHEGRGKEHVSWDLVQKYYDRVLRGGGWLDVLGIIVAVPLVAMWRVFSGRRTRESTLVNAAITWGNVREIWEEQVVEM
jgi:hypothetical protein